MLIKINNFVKLFNLINKKMDLREIIKTLNVNGFQPLPPEAWAVIGTVAAGLVAWLKNGGVLNWGRLKKNEELIMQLMVQVGKLTKELKKVSKTLEEIKKEDPSGKDLPEGELMD